MATSVAISGYAVLLLACGSAPPPAPASATSTTAAPTGNATSEVKSGEESDASQLDDKNGASTPTGAKEKKSGDKDVGDGTVGIGSLSNQKGGGASMPIGGVTEPMSPKVTGSLGVDAVKAGLHPQMNRVRACYQEALAGNPAIKGRIEAKIVVASDGTVVSVDPASATIADTKMVACVFAALKEAKFAATGSAGKVEIWYPIDFAVSP